MGFLERRPGLSEFLQGLACINWTDADDQLCNRLPDKTKCESRGITKGGWEYCRKNKVNTLGKTYNVKWLLVEGVDIFGLKGFQHIGAMLSSIWVCRKLPKRKECWKDEHLGDEEVKSLVEQRIVSCFLANPPRDVVHLKTYFKGTKKKVNIARGNPCFLFLTI